MTDELLGTAIDGWRILTRIGQGAMGTVYDARKGAERAAVKVIRPDATDQENLGRFRREAKLLQQVDHPNVVRCLGTGSAGDGAYVALEFLDGGSLQEILERQGRLAPGMAVHAVRAVLAGLDVIHRLGIVHRDIKPANVLLDREGKVKLADFGLARPDEASTALTATGTILGTPFYMAPELIRGKSVTPSIDIYACGAMLWTLLVGEPPYPGTNPLKVLQAHLNDPIPQLRKHVPDASSALCEAVDALLQKEPRDRPETAAAARDLLGGLPETPLGSLVNRTPDDSTLDLPPPPKKPDTARRRRPAAEREAAVAAAKPRPLPLVPASGGADRLALGLIMILGLVQAERLLRAGGIDPLGLARAWLAARDADALSVQVALAIIDALAAAAAALEPFAPLLGLVIVALLIERALARILRIGPTERILLQRRAASALARGDFPAAATALEGLGRRAEAAELLFERGFPGPAADLFLAAGLAERAAVAATRAATEEKALRSSGARGPALLERSGDGLTHARELLAAGQVDAAVSLLRTAGRRYDAADILEREGRLGDAAAELAAAHVATSDGRDYWNHLGKKGQLEEARPRLARRIAGLHRKLGARAEEAAWLEKAGDGVEAAAIHEALGDHRGLARCLLQGVPPEGQLTDEARERVERAARALLRAADPRASALLVRAGRVREAAEAARKIDPAMAAQLYVQAGLPGEAASCAEQAGDKALAAELHDEAGNHARAAELYAQLGQLDEAASAASRAGDDALQAVYLEKTGRFVDAAEALIRVASDEEARRVLERVVSDDPTWQDSRTLLGEVHHRAGRHAEAVAAYDSGLPEVVHFHEEVPAQLHFAESLAATGDVDRALRVLARLDGKDIAPKDLAERRARIQRSSAPGGSTPTVAAVSNGGDVPQRTAGGRDVTPKELIGTSLERYELLRYVGEGSFAWVFEARHTTLGRQAAVKVLKPGLAMGEAPRRFLREGRAVAGLKHPHLIEIYDAGDVDGLYFLALEFVKGPTLRQLIADEAPFPYPRAARIGAGILSGVGAAHKKGIVHRDLKPANVLVGSGMQAKVLDFGLARVFDDAGQSATAGYLGTPRYASPEQARGAEVSEGADQYAAGLVLYEMLTGKMPFESKTSLGYLSLHAHEPPRPILDLRPDCPPSIAEAVMRSLEKNPKDRFDNVGAFERVLAQFLAAQKKAAVGGPSPPTPAPGGKKDTGRRPR